MHLHLLSPTSDVENLIFQAQVSCTSLGQSQADVNARKSCLVPITNLRADHSHGPTVRAFDWKSCYDLLITYSNPLFLNYLHWQITTIFLQKDLCLSKACQKNIWWYMLDMQTLHLGIKTSMKKKNIKQSFNQSSANILYRQTLVYHIKYRMFHLEPVLTKLRYICCM